MVSWSPFRWQILSQIVSQPRSKVKVTILILI